MKLLIFRRSSEARRPIDARHEFIIGPPCASTLNGRKARLYFCRRCRWRFLVSEHQVALLDEQNRLIDGEDSIERLRTFAEGPCPVLEAFASAAPVNLEPSRLSTLAKPDSRRQVTPPLRVREGRPALRLLSRFQES